MAMDAFIFGDNNDDDNDKAMATHVRLVLYPWSILSAIPVLILAMPTYSLPCCHLCLSLLLRTL